jgi:exopolysaccharide biosynthesis polyprenyl glycosylphosphotransferase
VKAQPFKRQLTQPSAVQAPRQAPRWLMPTVGTLLVLADVALIITAFLSAFYLREGHSILRPAGGLAWSTRFAPYGALLPFVLLIRLLMLFYYNLYKLRGEFSAVDDGVRIFKATAVGSLLIVAVAFLYRGGFQFRSFSYSRAIFVIDFAIALFSFALLRAMVRTAQTVARRRNLNLIPTLVVGRGPEAEMFIREMRERPELGYRVIGVAENSPPATDNPTVAGVPVISDLAGLSDAIRDSRADEVVIADKTVSADALFEVMMALGRKGVEFRIVPSLFNVLPSKTEIDQIGALPMITLFRSPLSGAARVVKRASDLLIASVAGFITLPISLLIALLIKLDSKGPVVFAQERVGMDGRIFLCYKFRTMRAGAEATEHHEVYLKNIAGVTEANVGNAERPVYGKLREDPRVTRVGRWLRRTSLDELPQLLNVLRGDMSVVGPRPPIPYEVESYDLWHRKRLDMKPGVTGLWQVSGRNRLPFAEMVRLDLYYIENWSLLLDLKIMLRTALVMLKGDGF